ncbi:hypothetical protein [Haloarchaeobius amylolyticus]|uniref:hypothetical protein n=1 Tax=Haloarchaeobius amylolyticus TaxID=1198296 RepID=UPI00226E4BD8|nr:hypothetical protein [Haloarchaeobius amylolyticus]
MGEGTTTNVPSEKAILSALDAVSSMHVAELCYALGGDPGPLDHQCDHLERAGFVRARDGETYSITSKGEQRLRVLLRDREPVRVGDPGR